MKTSNVGIDLIKSFEGCILKAYKCPAGVWTIGYGHTAGVEEGQKITQAQAEEFLKEDLKRFETYIENLVTVKINQYQFDALVSFCYNVGPQNLKTSTLLKLLNKGYYEEAAEQFDRWVKAGDKKLAGLVKRRAAEKELFLRSTGPIRYKVVATALNVRTGPGTTFKRTKIIYKNDIVEIMHTQGDWGLLANDAGWVYMYYLKKFS